jgi:hypothetical protein
LTWFNSKFSDPLTEGVDAFTFYSINSATIFSKFQEMGETSKGQKIADFYFGTSNVPTVLLN